MASFATEPPPPGPSAKNRRLVGVFIAAFVAFQFAVPLTYLVREDSSDERFTWRHLTAPAETFCRSEISVERTDGSTVPVELDSLVHAQWIDYLQRDRQAVVHAVMRAQCEQADVARVRLINRCDDARGAREYELPCRTVRPEPMRAATR